MDVETIFRLWGPVYDHPIFQRTFYRRVHARVMARLDGLAPRRVLDLGCGTAQLTDDLRRRFPAALVVGLDLSDAMLHAARVRLGGEAPPLLRANVYALPFADGALDLVTSSISYHWYLEPERALAEIHRVLAPGGRFVLATVSSLFLERQFGRMRYVTAAHHRRDFERAGFSVESLDQVGPLVLPRVTLIVGVKR